MTRPNAWARALARVTGGAPPFAWRFKRHIDNGIFTRERHSFGSPRVRQRGEQARLHPGSFTRTAAEVIVVLGSNRRVDWTSTLRISEFPQDSPGAAGRPGHPATRGNVYIGRDVWIGDAAVVSSVRMGNDAVAGARSVVVRNVEPYLIVADNPAVEVRVRGGREVIEALESSGWRNWSDDTVARNLDLLIRSTALACFHRRMTRQHTHS